MIYTLEKESIPNWTKFLQGYYDTSGIASDSFDPGVGYWALVLEETYISIPPPSESITVLFDPFSVLLIAHCVNYLAHL